MAQGSSIFTMNLLRPSEGKTASGVDALQRNNSHVLTHRHGFLTVFYQSSSHRSKAGVKKFSCTYISGRWHVSGITGRRYDAETLD